MSIYFIQCGKNGPIKIGYTDKDPKERLSQLQTACPYELKLLWVYKDDDYSEKQIHEELKHEHIRGEWFRPGNDVLAFIRDEMVNRYTLDLIMLKNELSIIESFGDRIEIGFGPTVLFVSEDDIYISTTKEVKIAKGVRYEVV